MKKLSGFVFVLLAITFMVSACVGSTMPTLTDAEQTAIAGTVTAVFSEKLTQQAPQPKHRPLCLPKPQRPNPRRLKPRLSVRLRIPKGLIL